MYINFFSTNISFEKQKPLEGIGGKYTLNLFGKGKVKLTGD